VEEYVGECKSLEDGAIASATDNFIFEVKGSRKTDGFLCNAVKFGNLMRFINHSHDPNTKFYVGLDAEGNQHIGIWTDRITKPNEELTISYGWELEPGNQPTECLCGSSNCTGFIEILPEKKRKLKEQEVIVLFHSLRLL